MLKWQSEIPLRVIRDPYPAYSAVAVDPIRDEVIMTDENLFSILVYNRLDNTPPGATMTEPKRRIQGENTRIEFQCGVYIGELSSLLAKAPNQLRGLLVTRLRGSGGLAFAKIALAICSAVAWILGVE